MAGRITDGETNHSGISGLNVSRFDLHVYHFSFSHRVDGNRKRINQQSTNADQNSIEAVFSIAIVGRQMTIEKTVSIDF